MRQKWIHAIRKITLTGTAAALFLSLSLTDLGTMSRSFAPIDTAAAAAKQVTITYPTSTAALTLDKRLPLASKLKLSADVALRYESGNSAVARVNSNGVVIPVAAGTTNIWVHVASADYTGSLKLPLTVKASSAAYKVTTAVKKVKVSGKTFSVQTVTIPKGMPVTAGLAGRRVGAVQQLADIGKSYRAVAAINGTYFEAYGGVPDPYGTVISDGVVEHIGNTGTSVGFKWDGSAVMDTLRIKVRGATNGSYNSPNNWYVYFVNRTPTKGAASAVMFTPKRGANVGFSYGKAVTVRKGVVTKTGSNANADIPKDGYVLVFTGSEEKLASRFKVGTFVDYKVTFNNAAGQAIDWSGVHTAIGAGPRLVKDGQLAVDPAKEGFSSPKILTDSGARSGIAIKKDGTVILATVPGATIKQWGYIMLGLGANQAMNLDGGASSGLYASGKMITTPGRLISNTLLFSNNPKW
ncbi:phosphodiester glycosidase family protein [Paenibacillus sp. NEAU-GSW1]|uniref:phosphodiester glycosidase family protein n=1 Tax=Paenibacillus sp. NEAU-GSW1 TaxID=2682486 RepID=UPI0012E14818|nr:phosphodiester glycosidase family protein [Paenibacillus sp. NEAU-GSW1]MUT65886.1 phosphodiester glycosidase family protein [Paenibacillus sp. NEAU-GSW1]